MWLHRFTDYLLRHRLRALGFTFFITFVPVIGILGILIAGLMTLVKGIREGALFTLAACLPFLIIFWLRSHDPALPIVIWTTVLVAVLSNIVTWLFASMLRQKMSWSSILQLAALAGVLIVSVVHLVYPEIPDWWSSQLQAFYDHMTIANSANTAQGVSAEAVKQTNNVLTEAQIEAIKITKNYATGMVVTVILMNALVQLMVARWWQGVVLGPRLLRRELHSIRLNVLAGVLFIFSIVFWYLGNSVVLDIMPIIYLLFGVAGLSVIHYLFNIYRSPMTWFWMALFYTLLILALPASAIMIGMVALFDIGFDIRKHVKK